MSIMRSFCDARAQVSVSNLNPRKGRDTDYLGLTWAWVRPWFTTHMKPYVRIASRTSGASLSRPSGVCTFVKSMMGTAAYSTFRFSAISKGNQFSFHGRCQEGDLLTPFLRLGGAFVVGHWRDNLRGHCGGRDERARGQ